MPPIDAIRQFDKRANISTEELRDFIAEDELAPRAKLYLPIANNHGGCDQWAFIEILNPWNAENEISVIISTLFPDRNWRHGNHPK